MFLDRIVYWSLLYEEKVWYTFLVNIISCSTAGFSEIVSTNISENFLFGIAHAVFFKLSYLSL